MVGNVERDDLAAGNALERESRPLMDMRVTKDAELCGYPKISENHSSMTMDSV